MKQHLRSLNKLLFVFFFLFSTSYVMAQKSVTGTVEDNEGLSLPGVTVVLKGTTLGTVTDMNGKYELDVPEGKDTLVFSFVGMTTVEKPITGSVVNCILQPMFEQLEEVLVIGYGTMKKTDKTGAVSNVSSKEIGQGVLTDPVQALQGKAAGVLVTKKGGDPNAGFSVKIRNSASLKSSTDPLYVVDGIPGVDPTTIAPEDIESFNVLKDASSTAIYGARGANGVIFITTKKGKLAKGKKSYNKVEFNSYVSIDKVANRLDLLTADEMRQYVQNSGDTGFVDGGANTDWQDEVFRTGMSQSFNLAASGGDENSSYRTSITRTNFKGVVLGTEKERTIGRINLLQKALDDKLTLQSNIAGTFENNDYVSYEGNGPNDVLYQAFQRNPTDPVKNPDGSFYEINRDFNYYNPVALIEDIQNERDAKRFFGSLKADLEVFKGFTVGTNIGYTRDDNESNYFEPSYVRNNSSSGFGRKEYNNAEKKLIETTISYVNDLNAHHFNAVGGHSFEENVYTGLWAQGTEPLSDYVKAHNLGVLNNVNSGDIGSYKTSSRLISLFGRLGYNYDYKYYITGTIRRDGSSKFGENNEWGWFPSGSVAWNLSNESFMENIGFISMLKTRVGYGLSGNQEIDPYLDILFYERAGTAINPETGEDAINFTAGHSSNPDLKWEENKELNIGLDYGLFNNRISGSIEYYNKKTYDFLYEVRVPVPPYPVERQYINLGEIENHGIEFSLQAFVFDKPNFDWKTSFTYASNKQKINSLYSKKFDQGLSYIHEGYLSGRGLVGDINWTQLIAEGYELGTFYMPEYAGISSDGRFLFYTAAGGVTRNQSEAERRVVGHAQPDFTLGWSNYFTIGKKIDISFAARTVYGYDVLNVTALMFGSSEWLPTLNVLQEAVDNEKELGLKDTPKLNSYYLEDGSFFRLDYLTIGYSFNTKEIKFLSRFDKIRLYFTSNNLLTITGYSGIDPEISYDGLSFGLDQYNVYPKTRTITFGTNIMF